MLHQEEFDQFANVGINNPNEYDNRRQSLSRYSRCTPQKELLESPVRKKKKEINQSVLRSSQKELLALSDLKKLSDSPFYNPLSERSEFLGWGSTNEGSSILNERKYNKRRSFYGSQTKSASNGPNLMRKSSVHDSMNSEQLHAQEKYFLADPQPSLSHHPSPQFSSILKHQSPYFKLNQCLESKKLFLKNTPLASMNTKESTRYKIVNNIHQINEDPSEIIENLKKLQEELASPEKPRYSRGILSSRTSNNEILESIQQIDQVAQKQTIVKNTQNLTLIMPIEGNQTEVMPLNPKLKQMFVEKQLQRYASQSIDHIDQKQCKIDESQQRRSLHSPTSHQLTFSNPNTNLHTKEEAIPSLTGFHPTSIRSSKIRVTPSHSVNNNNIQGQQNAFNYIKRSISIKQQDDSQKENEMRIIEHPQVKKDKSIKSIHLDKKNIYSQQKTEGSNRNSSKQAAIILPTNYIQSDKLNNISIGLKNSSNLGTDMSMKRRKCSGQSLLLNQMIMGFEKSMFLEQEKQISNQVHRNSLPQLQCNSVDEIIGIVKSQQELDAIQLQSDKPKDHLETNRSKKNDRPSFAWESGRVGFKAIPDKIQKQQAQKPKSNLLRSRRNSLSFALDGSFTSKQRQLEKQQLSQQQLQSQYQQPQVLSARSPSESQPEQRHSQNSVLPEIMRLVTQHAQGNSTHTTQKSQLHPSNIFLLPPKIPTLLSKKEPLNSSRF